MDSVMMKPTHLNVYTMVVIVVWPKRLPTFVMIVNAWIQIQQLVLLVLRTEPSKHVVSFKLFSIALPKKSNSGLGNMPYILTYNQFKSATLLSATHECTPKI